MQPASAGLEKVVADSLRRVSADEAPVLAWPLACGHKVAERTRAVSWANGVLRVEVPDLGWRSELQALAPRYVAAINRYVSQSVKRIEFVVSAPLK
jgi:Dna[CI] antecedent, DciA